MAGDVGTPPVVQRKLFDPAQHVMERPEVKAALAREGTEVVVSRSLEEFAAFLVNDNHFWVRVAKGAAVKPD